jgi:hypothetical protein
LFVLSVYPVRVVQAEPFQYSHTIVGAPFLAVPILKVAIFHGVGYPKARKSQTTAPLAK